MKMIFTGKVSGEKTVLAAGDRHTVKAQAGEQYGLVDEVTGLVPDGVEADRSGDDLILRKKEDDTEIRIEGFWEECQPGETQCTAVFNVVGENGQVTEAVLTQDGPVLENFTAGQSGTLAEGINNGIIWGGIAFGAGLAAIALAAGGGGGSSRHKSTAEGEQKPVQPEGGQETGKTDVSSTGSTKPESGNSSGQVPEVNDQDGNGKADAAAVAAATAAVEAAEAADQAAKDKLAELNADNLITPEEKAQLEAAKQNADTLKGEADSAVKALPDTAAEKGGLQDRVDALDGIQVPEVNDQDGNGKADAEEVAAATAAVEAAEAADQAAKDKLAELNTDNLITPEEKAQLEAAKQNADTLKGEADSAVKALPDTAAEKGGLQDRVDALDGIQVPEVNDQDGNGKADAAAVAAATAAVEAAEAADQAAKDKLAELNADNLITPEEKAQLEAAKQNADTLKGEADSAVKALPDTAAEKGGLQDRVDALDGIQVPEVNDQDGNGKADAEEVAAATAAVEAAEAADQAAKDKLAELNADNLITPEEKAQLEAAKQNADTLKGEADSAVKALPDTAAEKGGLQDRVDALDGIQVPEVNDQDGNGKADAEEVAAATAAVEAAEAADQAAKDKLAELNADNLITPEEKAQLEAAKQNADTLKGEADSAVKALPDTAAEKGGLQDRVDALDGIQVPEVNDQDGNGKADAAAVAAATAAVEAAEAADQAAKDKLAELNADNLITPEEKAQLEAAKQNADTLKGEADSAVKALPDTAAEKGGLQDRVDALDGIQVPEVNDQDGNGKADAAAVAAATAAVEAAEAADQAAKDKLAELNADNLITPEEKAQLEAAKQNADTLKGEADSAVKALPDTAAEKGGLQDRVDALDGIQVPEVNDQDGNGKADAEEVAAATAAVEAAEAADQAAKDKLAELNTDNLITPEEKAQLEAAKQNADTLKGEADSAVKALPDTAAEKGGLQDRVDALDGIQVPEVNDQDGNGKADAAAVAAATAAVEAAEAADQAAKDKLAELNADNLITPEEKAQLEAAKQNADTLKGEADSAVKALPDTAAEKGGLQDRVDALDGIQVPEVNDQDGNGKADAAAVAAATAAVEAAEAADQAAKDKLAELNADNLITPEEKAQLEAAKQNADTLKGEADSAVKALPDTAAEKGGLQDRVDALDGIQVPEVNDQDGNGKADAAAVAAATAAVEAAEAADQAAKDKLAELNADNLITPEEKAQLEAAKQNADTLKGEADSAVKALPDTAAEKGGLQDRVDALDGIQVPEVNDQDGNGKADAAAVAAATAAVEAAEAADQAAKDKLAELNADNLITPEEKAQLEAAKQNADTLKGEADSAVKALPDTAAEKGGLQDRVDALDGIQVPEVNDQDGNGKADAEEVAAATAAVEAAEAADQAAKDKLAELNTDNLITPEEKAQLEAAKQNADTLKGEADSAVKALPDTAAEKGGLQDRVDALDGIQVPEVNDQDGNGKADVAAVAAATAAVEAAEAADQAAKDKLAELNADNLITPEEKAQLEAAKQNADTLKGEADSAVKALPDTAAEKGGLQDRVDALDGIQVPEVNDQDGNGKADAAAVAAATAAVEAAEAADQAAKDKLAELNADNLITPEEKAQLEAAKQNADTLKGEADSAVKALPDTAAEKGGLQDRVDALDGIQVPEVNDQDGNGKADAAAVAAATAAVEAAEAADQAAKDKLAELNADNLITPEEKAQLEAAKQNADTLKGEADSAVKALPDTAAEKGGLQDRVDALDGIQVPEVNDQDGNGKADAAAVAAATAAVEAAEAADQAAKDKLAELNADNLITPEEKAQLEAAKQNADTLKGEADSAVKALPDTAAEKGGLQDRVDALDGIQVPEVNDQDGNGKADVAAVAAATAAVEAAEAADQAAKDKLAELNADNLITPEEKAQLEAAKQNADTLKGEADSAVKALPDTAAEKGGLQDRVDALDGIQVPEVNDQDGNGKADAAAVAAATAAVEAAEAADQAAKDKLAELNADNLITPEEKAQLEAAKQNADTLKGEADSAVKALPDTAAEKGGLQDRVDALDGIQVPEVNDQDGNGKADAEEVAAATAAVEAAEAADQAAKDKLAELNADNLITPEEKAQLEAAKQNADTLKGEADSAVKALPDTAAEKGGLQDRVDALDGIQVPEVNDQDGNGKADAEEVAAATAAVEAAEAADQAAKDKLAELNTDNLITPEEKAQLEAAKQNADTLKGEADSAVKALPDTAAEKGGLQDRVDALDGIQVPEVNDQDGNGKADVAAVAAATAAVEAAEAADQAAKDKLAELNADNLITPEEKAQLEAAKQNADTLKGEADSAVKALPDTAAEKGGLQDRVDALDGIQVPEVNDQDGNGKADAEEVAAATAAVEAAEAADQAAKDKLAELNADNLITPEEKAQLEAAKQNADTLKGEADSAVKALPDTAAEKGGLQDRVDALDGIQVPEVNDQDGNGKADAEEVAAATAAVEAAEAADQAAKDKLAELNADNLITPEEKAQLEAAKQNADTLKGEADSAVKALPDTAAEKGGLQDRVDALDGIQVPEVNDQDGNGKADAEEVAAATAAVEAAEAADQAAKDKLAELNADNLITPEEKAQLEAAKQNADTLKGEADSAVKALPDTAAEKGGLQDRVDALDGIQVPEVNDQDGNGKADAEEVAAATAAVEAAEAADQAAKDKLAELNADNLITPEEKAQLEAAKQNADTLKGEADSAVKALPDTAAEKGGLQDRVDALDGIQVPEVNDQDGNGKADAEEVAAATAAVEAAEAADQAAKDKLAELNADNLITPEEKAQLEAAKQNADTLKGEADSAVKALPDTAAEKGGLQDRVDALDGIQVPEVNDQDGNGKADAEEVAAATAAVEAAEAADQAAKDKLAELNADNLITPEEKAQLEAAKQNADTLKGEADSAVKALPDTAAEKGGLQDRVDALDGIQVPEVNDQDGNGKADAEEAAEARVFYEKAFSNVYQTGDLYAKTDSTSLFAPAATKLAKSTSQWATILEKNAGAQMSQDQNAGGETRYIYNGSSESDVITVGESLGGTGLNMSATRNDMKVITGDGDDIIITGRDYGRLASSGQWDYKYLTEMGDGNDTLIVGASNSNLNVILFNDGSIGAVNKDNSQFGDVIPFDSAYDTSSGGQISGTTIDMGSGNDTVLALGYESGGTAVINATIKLGAGNDTIQINGDVKGGNSPSVITGDAGMDTLIITNGSVVSEHFSGFEKIELGSKGEVKIVAEDLVGNDSNVIQGGMLKITGNSDSKVDLDGEWIKGETRNEGDITYTSYTHESAPGISVLIEDKITQII
ncbi:GA-like domain-containing protein [Escherichia coli]|uniref:GA-like domain-containing protein n=1 Tax=Escherichia coli TaxID=562 RepID=UPI002647689E|nr:hypothetical protein [Escherichia coli]WKC27671.1 hypothetical protein QYF46_21685 [Escherichia coli]